MSIKVSIKSSKMDKKDHNIKQENVVLSKDLKSPERLLDSKNTVAKVKSTNKIETPKFGDNQNLKDKANVNNENKQSYAIQNIPKLPSKENLAEFKGPELSSINANDIPLSLNNTNRNDDSADIFLKAQKDVKEVGKSPVSAKEASKSKPGENQKEEAKSNPKPQANGVGLNIDKGDKNLEQANTNKNLLKNRVGSPELRAKKRIAEDEIPSTSKYARRKAQDDNALIGDDSKKKEDEMAINPKKKADELVGKSSSNTKKKRGNEDEAITPTNLAKKLNVDKTIKPTSAKKKEDEKLELKQNDEDTKPIENFQKEADNKPKTANEKPRFLSPQSKPKAINYDEIPATSKYSKRKAMDNIEGDKIVDGKEVNKDDKPSSLLTSNISKARSKVDHDEGKAAKNDVIPGSPSQNALSFLESTVIGNKSPEKKTNGQKPRLLENIEDINAINKNERRRKIDLELIPHDKKSVGNLDELSDLERKKAKKHADSKAMKLNIKVIDLTKNKQIKSVVESLAVSPRSIVGTAQRGSESNEKLKKMESPLKTNKILDDKYVEELVAGLNGFEKRNMLWEINRQKKILLEEQKKQKEELIGCTFEPKLLKKKDFEHLSPTNFYRKHVDYKEDAMNHATKKYVNHMKEQLEVSLFKHKYPRVKSSNQAAAIYIEKKSFIQQNDKTTINNSGVGEIGKSKKKNAINIDDFLKTSRFSHNMYLEGNNNKEMIGHASTRFKPMSNAKSTEQLLNNTNNIFDSELK